MKSTRTRKKVKPFLFGKALKKGILSKGKFPKGRNRGEEKYQKRAKK